MKNNNYFINSLIAYASIWTVVGSIFLDFMQWHIKKEDTISEKTEEENRKVIPFRR